MMRNLILFTFFCFAVSCSTAQKDESFAELPPKSENEAIATFAGGCFWCTETVFERVEGVNHVISGYAGGDSPNPTYREVSMGETTHAEAIQVYYNPKEVSYETLLDVFFLGAHDPTQVNRQGPDVGPQYRSIAFYQTEKEREMIENKISELEKKNEFEKPIATEVEKLDKFYPAEKYHQGYYEEHPNDRYILQVSKPKVEKFEKRFSEILKTKYKKE